jgi:hypothetical protein
MELRAQSQGKKRKVEGKSSGRRSSTADLIALAVQNLRN